MKVKIIYIDDSNGKIKRMAASINELIDQRQREIKETSKKNNEVIEVENYYLKRKFEGIDLIFNLKENEIFESYSRDNVAKFKKILDKLKFNKFKIIFVIDAFLETEEHDNRDNSYYILRQITKQLLELTDVFSVIYQTNITNLQESEWRKVAGLTANGKYSNFHFFIFDDISGGEYGDLNMFKKTLYKIVGLND
ncbi:hypothetical protein [Candidatus Stoquefichus massiliensis]|uniref:hypothetical protein n=1 Tax=Candidatus Stoquefichus massiliensis TaxID=1470350 RepID=UPI0004847022|nr:hypothetical protein [Candidatus Stoquefichus massiliensis]